MKQAANLPWNGSLQGDIASVRKWIETADKKPKDDEYIKALTILPRILSLTDLSYPIILFSSTGRRDITKALEDYGNIVTDFDKPKFTVDIPDDIAEQTKAKFINAMKSAFTFLQGRHAIHEIEKAAEIRKPNQLSPGDKYVEIFIDESGDVFDGYFIIGGLVLVHKNENAAEAFNNIMRSTRVSISNNGTSTDYDFVWCGTQDILPKRLGTNYDEEISAGTQLLLYIDRLLKQADTIIALPIILRAKVNSIQGINVLHNEHLDNLYLKQLRELLDAVIYELLPWYIGKSEPVICKVIAGTRARTKNRTVRGVAEDFTSSEIQKLNSDYGIKVIEKSGNQRYLSLTATSFIPIVSDIVFARQDTNFKNLKIAGALGQQLEYDRYPCPKVRHAHYFADLIAHYDYLYYAKNQGKADVFSNFQRMVDIYDNCFMAALDASKHLDAKDLVNAFLSAYYAKRHYDPTKYPESIIPKILARVIQSESSLNGAQFKQFSLLLDSWHHTAFNAPPRKAQTDKRYLDATRVSKTSKKQNKVYPGKTGFTDPSKRSPQNIQNSGKNIPNEAHRNVNEQDIQKTSGHAQPQVSSSLEKEPIEVVSIPSNPIRFICKRNNGEMVQVNIGDITKSLRRERLKVGDIIKGVIFAENEKLYANEIELLKKAESSREDDANK